jgi:hypothetical protein
MFADADISSVPNEMTPWMGWFPPVETDSPLHHCWDVWAARIRPNACSRWTFHRMRNFALMGGRRPNATTTIGFRLPMGMRRWSRMTRGPRNSLAAARPWSRTQADVSLQRESCTSSSLNAVTTTRIRTKAHTDTQTGCFLGPVPERRERGRGR